YSVLFRTGDLARIVDGVLVYEGRADSQIKIRGHRVDINQVKLSMLKVDHVDKVHVMCYMPGEVNQRLILFHSSQDDKLLPEKFREKLCSLLQPHMIPQLIQMDELPLLVNGKVDGQQLLKLYEQRQEGDEREVEVDVSGVSKEEAGVARTLLLTVARVLGPQVARSQRLSLNTSFFDIGGNSLNSVLVVTSLIDLGYSIGIGQFMKAKTFREVVTKLRRVSLQEEDIGDMCRQAGDTDQYTCHMLDHHHKDAVSSLIGESYCKMGDLEQWVHTQPWEYVHLLDQLYNELLHQQLSYVLTRKCSEEVVACSLNFDLNDEPPLPDLSPELGYIITFVDHCIKLSKGFSLLTCSTSSQVESHKMTLLAWPDQPQHSIMSGAASPRRLRLPESDKEPRHPDDDHIPRAVGIEHIVPRCDPKRHRGGKFVSVQDT
ncbi:beta-alanyl-bioamine nonribosomal peptide synthetase ebony-like, partial [Cherax quadricarinatus]|uniref:beta-alanyl-bioamine nonribosomal peptide synthetase ebony-like n=1 Tax=Cherax quadricarinatus TaxID=27406 RepID=UPI00387EC007